MNVVALRSFNRDAQPVAAADSRIARVEVFRDWAEAEPHWRALERQSGACGSLATPYQAFDFLKSWQNHIGAACGVTPFIVTGFNAQGEALFVWPLGLRRRAGRRVVEFLGGKHTNFNMALWRRDAAADIGVEELRGVLAGLAHEADAIMLTNQPLTWAGATNPFALLPHQASASFGHSGALAPDFEALLRDRTNAATRKKMRKKERALAEMGAVRFERVAGDENIRRVLDVFFKQKAARMRAIGASDAFAEPGVRRFIESGTALRGGAALIELYALSVDDIVVATFGGITGGGRFCAMFNSIASGRYAAESPGEQLLVHLVRQCCERGFDTFDLGIGESRYKGLFCGDAEPLFDSYWPLTASGHGVVVAWRVAAAVKRMIKQRPALWSIVRAMRGLRAGIAAML